MVIFILLWRSGEDAYKTTHSWPAGAFIRKMTLSLSWHISSVFVPLVLLSELAVRAPGLSPHRVCQPSPRLEASLTEQSRIDTRRDHPTTTTGAARAPGLAKKCKSRRLFLSLKHTFRDKMPPISTEVRQISVNLCINMPLSKGKKNPTLSHMAYIWLENGAQKKKSKSPAYCIQGVPLTRGA